MNNFIPKRAIHQYIKYQNYSGFISRMRYTSISQLSEIILLRVKNWIEIILFFKTHFIHLVVRAQF